MASEGFSRINPLTKKPEYILPSGIIVPVTPATTKAIAEGKSDISVLAESKPKNYSGGTSYSPSSVVPTQPFTPIPPSSQQVQINQEEIRQARQAEIQRKLAEAEKRRIEQIAMELKRKGAQEQQKITSNKQGEKIRTTTISLSRIQNGKDVSGMVFKYENLDTGEVRYRDYSGFRKKFSGGVDFSQQSSKDSRVIKKDLQESGLNPIIRNGQIIGFSSPDTMKTYKYSDAGIQAFNRDIQNSGAQLRQQARLQKEQGMSYIPFKKGFISSEISTLGNRGKSIKEALKSPANAKVAIKSFGNLMIAGGKKIPEFFYDYVKQLGKGGVKLRLYGIDSEGIKKQLVYNLVSGKVQIPKNIVLISDGLGRTKEWANYNFKRNPLKDPDIQVFAFTGAMSALGLGAPAVATRIFGAVKGKAVYDAIKDPTPENVAVVQSLFLPKFTIRSWRGIKKAVARRDVLVAKSGELVPLKERITQVDYAIRNAGKNVETITAKASGKAKYTNVRSIKNPDYTYGKTIEFATYKVGKAYPTSEYFLSGKGTRLQKLLKTGRVNIERVKMAMTNAKYGKYIKQMLLKKGRVPESFIKRYYTEAKLEANRLKRPVAVISPKRLRGFWQAEQELVKILPDRYVPKKLKFGGITEEGYRIFTDKSRTANLKSFIKSKFTKGKIERSYFKELTKDKLEYLRGRKAIKGEYQEHGLKHLKAKELDSYSKKYAQKMNVKKFGNVFDKHDLAKVGDVESFAQFEHGKVLYTLWKKGQFPDKRIYKLPKKIQRQIAEAYAGHTPARPRFIDIFKKRAKGDIQANKVFENLKWYIKNKKNPYLQDTLTLDRLDLPRAGRWSYRVKYNLLDKNALKRIYGSELNAVKNIRFLDWKTVPSRLKRALSPKIKNSIMSRDRILFKKLKSRASIIQKGLKNKFSRQPLRRTYKPVPKQRPTKLIPYKTSMYKSIKQPSYKRAYESGYKAGYKATYSRPTNYKTNYGKYQSTYAKGYRDGYKGNYIINYKTGGYTLLSPGYTKGYKPSYKIGYKGTYIPGMTPPITPPPRTPPIRLNQKDFQRRTLSKSQPTYYVVEKRGGKLVKLYPKPLTMKDARDYATYSIDNRLSRTAFFIPLGKAKRVVRPPKNIQGYFSSNSRKFRPYKIRFGKKRMMVNGYIEKRKFAFDQQGERVKRKLTPEQRRVLIKRLEIARSMRSGNVQKKPIMVKKNIQPRRKLTPEQRRVLIKRLELARRVRMRNLRRR
jgi:hypothetical protein